MNTKSFCERFIYKIEISHYDKIVWKTTFNRKYYLPPPPPPVCTEHDTVGLPPCTHPTESSCEQLFTFQLPQPRPREGRDDKSLRGRPQGFLTGGG